VDGDDARFDEFEAVEELRNFGVTPQEEGFLADLVDPLDRLGHLLRVDVAGEMSDDQMAARWYGV
jgi:hypothetical protein